MDLTCAMIADRGEAPGTIRVDGWTTANDWLCQFLADLLDIPVERPFHLGRRRSAPPPSPGSPPAAGQA